MKSASTFCVSISSFLVLSLGSQQVGFSQWVLMGSPAPRTAVISYGAGPFESLSEFLRLGFGVGRGEDLQPTNNLPEYPAGSAPSWGAMDGVASPVGTGVNLFNGNLFTVVPIVSWSNGLSFSLYHNSLDDGGVAYLSGNWRHSYSQELRVEGSQATLIDQDGSRIEFSKVGQAPYRHAIHRLELSPTAEGWVIASDLGSKRFFGQQGRLELLQDANGNQTKLKYALDGRLVQVSDPAKRSLNLVYSGGKLRYVQAPPLHNAGGLGGVLVRRFEFEFKEAKLSKVFSPRRFGTTAAAAPKFSKRFFYDAQNRLVKISDYGDEAAKDIAPVHPGKPWYYWQVEYEGQSGKVSQVTHPAVFDFARGEMVANSRSYQFISQSDQGVETLITDESGGVSRYRFDASGRLVRVIDALGRVVSQTSWTELNLPATTKNVLGMETSVDYDERGNPLTQSNFRGTVTSNFDSMDRLTSIQDPLGQLTQYEYQAPGEPQEANPYLIKAIQGPGGIANRARFHWSFAPPTAANECSPFNGQPTGMQDPNAVAQAFHYDGNGNLQSSEFGNTDDFSSCDTPDEECPNGDYLAFDTQTTGEVSAKKVPIFCPLVLASNTASQCEDPGDPPESEFQGCPRGEVCETDFDAAGNSIGSSCCGSPHLATPDPLTDEPQGNFRYDANNRLVYALDDRGKFPEYCAVDGKQGAVMAYEMKHNALGSLVEMDQALAHPDDCDNEDARFNSLDTCLGDIHWFPRQKQSYHSSASTRSAQHIYEKLGWREGSCESHPELTRDPIITTQQFDEAGRMVEVNRDGKKTSFLYRDSTVLPALEMTRPDGSKTLTWIDLDGATNKIVHLDAQGALVQLLSYSRDALGRILSETRETRNPAAADGYESSRREYVYGSGNLSEAELDAGSEPEFDKLYYRFLAEMNQGFALQVSDPNRLVSERLMNLDQTQGAIQYWNEYRYDPGGNRLVKVEKSSTGTIVAQTRYNYASIGFDPTTVPGTPTLDLNWYPYPEYHQTNYEGRGRNFLVSTQRFVSLTSAQPASAEPPVRIEFTNYTVEGTLGFRPAAKSKTIWEGGDGHWTLQHNQYTRYRYGGEIGTPTPKMGGMLAVTEISEYDGEDGVLVSQTKESYLYDLFGRRVGIHLDPNPYQPWLNDRNTIFTDYEGLSQSAIAQRKGARIEKGGDYVGDRFTKSFGIGTLTEESQDEIGNFDTSDNRDHYPLYDVMGNVSATLLDHDGDAKTSRLAKFQIHDAFGNSIRRSIEELGSYSWRAAEGSETDSHSGLVYMQARYYDPEIGRFIQADSLPIAGLTTQSMNRYIYCSNDPVNFSDASGHMAALVLAPALGLGLVLLYALAIALLLAILFGALAALLDVMSANECFAWWGPVWLAANMVAAYAATVGTGGPPDDQDPDDLLQDLLVFLNRHRWMVRALMDKTRTPEDIFKIFKRAFLDKWS